MSSATGRAHSPWKAASCSSLSSRGTHPLRCPATGARRPLRPRPRGANPDLQRAVRWTLGSESREWTSEDDPDAIRVYCRLIRQGSTTCADGSRVSMLGATVDGPRANQGGVESRPALLSAGQLRGRLGAPEPPGTRPRPGDEDLVAGGRA